MRSIIIDKYKELSVQAKSTIWFIVCSIMQKGISFITIPIFTRLLSPQEYGIYSLYLSWLQILTIFTSLYLYYGVFNNAMMKFEDDRDRYISSMQGLTITITTFLFIIFLITQNVWIDLFELPLFVIILVFMEMLVSPAISFWSGKQRFEYKYKKIVIITLAKSIANPVLGLLIVIPSVHRGYARIISVVLVEISFSLILMISQFLRGKQFFNKKYWKYGLKMAVPLLPHYLSGMILNQGDRIMIDKMVGLSEVAYYSVAYSIGMMTQIVTNAINNSFTPWFYQKLRMREYLEVNKMINFLLFFVGCIVMCLMICSPELVSIFGSEEYLSAALVIPPVAASVFFIFLYNILAFPQFYFEKTHFLLISSIVSAAINLILNYIFIGKFGYVAAGYTTLVCYIFYSLGHWIISERIVRKELCDVSIFNTKKICFFSIGIILFSISCNLLFDYIFLRYGLLLLLFIYMFIKKDELIHSIILIKNDKKIEKE